MRKTIKDLFLISLPLNDSQKRFVEQSKDYLPEKEVYELKQLLKTKKARIGYSSIRVSDNIIKDFTYPILLDNPKIKEGDIKNKISALNKLFNERSEAKAFEAFSEDACEKLQSFIAPNIMGFENIKKAVAIQLFASEKVHILLLGDPGTGKTDILRSAAELSPISSFGLGSGTSSAGLSVTMRGHEMIKGLLPLADDGLCAIDELNLIKKEDMASLYSAMEKGFISFDKADKHVKMHARINVLATANPKGDKFSGWMVETIKKQLPFDSALITRFHLVFIVKKPSVAAFKKIAEKILNNEKNKKLTDEDKRFIKRYVNYAKNIEVEIPGNIKTQIANFASDLKSDEDKFLEEVNPRLVHGFMNLCKSHARMELRDEVTTKDVEAIKKIFIDALYLKREE